MFNINLDKVVQKLKGHELQLPDLPSSKSAYQELEDLMLNSETIKKILKPENYIEERTLESDITKLTDENIFAVKFLQIKNSGFLSGYNPYRETQKLYVKAVLLQELLNRHNSISTNYGVQMITKYQNFSV